MAYFHAIAAGSILFFLFFLLFVSCGTQQIAGNTLEVGNPSVTGMLYEPGGQLPAQGAIIHIRKRLSPSDSTPPTLKKVAVNTAYTTTDENGTFIIGSLDIGLYAIEGNDTKNNLVLIDSVAITDTTQRINLPPDTLKRPGAISGIIRLSESGDPRKVFVLLFEVEKFARVETDGSFIIDNLAEARYTLRFIPAIEEYGVIDTAASVLSGDTTSIGIISPPFLGIPTPKNVTAANDPARQILTIVWNRCDTSVVAGCFVYRRLAGSGEAFAQLNTTPISDSVFYDSTVFGNLEFEYQVSCIGKNGAEGPKSTSAMVVAMSYFSVDTTISLCDYGPCSMVSLAVTPVGRVYVVDNSYQYETTVFDSALNVIGHLNLPMPLAIYAADDSEIYGESSSNRALYLMSSSQTLVRVFSGIQLSHFVLNSNRQLVGFSGFSPLTSDTIKTVETQHGSVVSAMSWPGSALAAKGVAIDKSNNLYLCEDKSRTVWVFDSSGLPIRSIGLNLPPQAIAVDAAGRIVVVVGRGNGQEVQVLDSQGKFLAQYNLVRFGAYYFDVNSINQCSLVCRGTTLYFGLDSGLPNTSTIIVKLTYRIPN
jgi:hypothetical protein